MQTRLFLVFALACATWLSALPAAAQAYGRPCPGGPGADELIIGMTKDVDGKTDIPLCGPRNQGDRLPQAPPTIVNRYGAIAWHADAADVWMVGNQDFGGSALENHALEACNRAMGGGCKSIGSWNNSSMSIIRDRSGTLYNAWNGDDGAVRKQVLAQCSARQALPCEVIGKFGSGKSHYIPDTATVRKSYALAAWVGGAEGYDDKLYIASGYTDLQEAENAALGSCTKATGRQCKIVAFSGNGYLQTYVLGGGDHSVTAETSPKRAGEAAKVLCKQKKQKCILQAVYDSRERRTFVHNFMTGEAQ